MNRIPRESVEFLPVTVRVDDVPVTTGVEFSVTSVTGRPSVWVVPTTLDGDIGIMVAGLEVGGHQVWARVTDSPETPVILCGEFLVT